MSHHLKSKMTKHLNQKGQAVTEYILLLALVVGLFMHISKLLSQRDWFATLAKPITVDFKYAYQYGHPTARGIEDGGQKFIALSPEEGNFRIFINPPTNR